MDDPACTQNAKLSSMKFFKTFLFATLVCALFAISATGKPAKGKPQKIYMMGISVSFVDSVAFLTDVQELDSAFILSNGFLAERLLYSFQLDNYVSTTCRVPNSTNAIYFSTKKKAMDTKYDKLNRMYQRSDKFALIYLGAEDFSFKREEHIEPIELDDENAEIPAEPTGKTKKSKKSKAPAQPAAPATPDPTLNAQSRE